MADFGLFAFATSLWRRWRGGLPDDSQKGVELGTFRTVSCPLFPQFPQEAYETSVFKDAREPEAETLQSSISVPLGNPTLDLSSTESFEFDCPSKKEGSDDDTFSDVPVDASVQLSQTSSSTEIIKDPVPLTVPSDFCFLVRHANRFLDKEKLLKEGDMDQVIGCIQEGVIPCLLLNSVVGSEMVDVRALNIPVDRQRLSLEDCLQNHILCCNSLTAADQNQRLPKIHPKELASGNPEACIALLRAIVDLGTIHMIDVHTFPELRALQEDSEDIFQFLQLAPEELLIRWVNFTLYQDSTDADVVVRNLDDDFKDARLFLKLQTTIESSLCRAEEYLYCLFSLSIVARHASAYQCGSIVLKNFEDLKIEAAHSVDDIVSGNAHLNAILLAQLFMSYHGLSVPSESIEDTDVDDFDDEGSREERTFRMWMNSLGVETNCRSLFSVDFRTGWMLLEVLDALHPDSIDWTKANKPPFKTIVSRIKSVENCDQVVRVAKDSLHLSLVGIGGDDIADGKKKPILALVWQMLRFHTLMILNSALESTASPRSVFQTQATGDVKARLNEADVLAWANHMLDISGSRHRIMSFKDPELSTSHALLALLKAIEPNAVQEKHITPGISPSEKEMNAKYVLSLSRKLGAAIFILWEDIVDVRPKMMLMLIASFILLDKQIRKLHRAATKHQGIGKNVRIAL